jgi:WD40 repeat protein
MSASPYPTFVGEICRFEGHSNWVQCVAFSPDGRLALSGSGQPPRGSLADADFTLRLWDVEAAVRRRFGDPLATIILPTGSDLERLYEQTRLTGHTDQITGGIFLPDGRHCLSAGYDATLRLWDVGSARELRRFTGHNGRIQAIAVSPDGRFALSCGCDRSLRLWDLEQGREVRRFPEHKHWVMCTAFSPDGRLAVSGGFDGAVRLWEVATGREVTAARKGGLFERLRVSLGRGGEPRFEGHGRAVTAVVFDPTGRRLLSAGADGTLRLWDVESGKEVRRFVGHKMSVTAAALSSDGRRALSGGLDHTVRLWDVATGQELHRYDGHAEVVSGVAFSPDGRMALSGSADVTVRLWGLPGRAES